MRTFFLNRRLCKAPPQEQPRLQFWADFGVFAGVGLLTAAGNSIFLGFPIIGSGLKLFIGFIALGVFVAAELSLRRQRELLRHPPDMSPELRIPRKSMHSLSRRLFLLASAVAVLVSIILIMVIVKDIHWLMNRDITAAAAEELMWAVMWEVIFVMAVLLALTINLLFIYSGNLKLLFDWQSDVLDRVSRGDLDVYAPVLTSDEFGYIAGYTNAMIDGLRDRLRLMEGMNVARQVQENLLPKAAPKVQGLDVAGRAIYSDETGGDYYDYLDLAGTSEEVKTGGKPARRLGVVVADVTGHGVGAALLMTTGRAFLRQRALQPGGIAAVAQDVNWQLARDVYGSGQFMTMFFCVVDPAAGEIRYVDAGHGPALLYRPSQDAFLDMKGRSLALGVQREFSYAEYSHDIQPGDVLVIATDGVWETFSPAGEMFGRTRMQDVVRRHANKSAAEIVDAVAEEATAFRGGGLQEDDVTLVAVKVQA